MKATKRYLSRSRKSNLRKNNMRRFVPQSETLEERRLLAADLILKTTPFDHDGKPETPIQPHVFSIESFDFFDGNALIKDYDKVLKGGTGQLLIQTQVTALADANGPIDPSATGGLNTDYEITAVMRASVALNGDGDISLVMPQTNDDFGLKLYYNNLGGKYGGSAADRANPLAGTGFDDGTLILEADVTRLTERVLITTPPLVRFDQVGTDNFAGFQTVFVTGAFAISADPTLVNSNHLDVRYGGPLVEKDLQSLFFNFNFQDPFTGVNPSKAFFAEDGGTPGNEPTVIPNLGAYNGAGPDLQAEVDSQIAIKLREGSIHGFKYEDVTANGVYDNGVDSTGRPYEDKPLAGVKFELWTDLDRDGKIEAGDSLVPGMVSVTNADGEYWFEPVTPGYYVIKEIANTPNNEVKPSTATEHAVFVCAGEELVWQEGAADFGQVVGRHIYYNNSYFDSAVANPGGASEAAKNNKAIATDKVALLPNGKGSFANYTSYTKGINGIIVDILNGGTHGVNPITKADFTFRVGNTSNPSLWGVGPDPSSVTAVLNGGGPGVTRVYIEWPANAIQNTWLQVRVLANKNTRLLEDDVHFWGNQIGETGNNAPGNPTAEVDGTDGAYVYSNLGEPVAVTNNADVTRDARVDGVDGAVIYDNLSFGINLITVKQENILPNGRWHYADEEVIDRGLLFGNYVVGSIHGFKFDDYEGDGTYDPDGWDLPFGGIDFTLERKVDGVWKPGPTVTTNSEGEFWFTNLAPGVYRVIESNTNSPDVMPSTSTVSREVVIHSGEEYAWKKGAAMLPSSGTLREEIVFEPNSDGIDEGLIFGNYVKGSIHGFKFEDEDGNGKYNEGDRPWAGINFNVYHSNASGEKLGKAQGPTATNNSGEFWFTGLAPGYYVVEEVLFPEANVEYQPSRPSSRLVFVGSREELVWKPGAAMLPTGALQHEIMVRTKPHPFDGGQELVFGNYIPGSIHGFKCEDIDANGSCEVYNDKGEFVGYEPGFPNVPIFLSGRSGDYTGDGNNVNLNTRTDENGHFWFENLKPGKYTVYEKVSPVGVFDGTDPSYVGRPNQGQLLDEGGNVVFANDNVMESQSNTISFTVTSRDEFVWAPGAGHFEKYCFTDNPGLAELKGEITHVLCAGQTAMHEVMFTVPKPADFYHVKEIETTGVSKDGEPANWTAGTYQVTPTGGSGMGLKFEYEIISGTVIPNAWKALQGVPGTGSNVNGTYTVKASEISTSGAGTGFAATVTVAGGSVTSIKVDAVGSRYAVGDKITIPFDKIGGTQAVDTIVLELTKVQSLVKDLVTVKEDDDTVGPDGRVLMGGMNYLVGDMFTVTPPGSVIGDVLAIQTTPVSQGSGYGAPGQPSPTFTYKNVPVKQAGGMTVDVVVDTNPASATYQKILSVALNKPGTGYAANQVVTVSGLLLDAGSDDDVGIKITRVGDDRLMFVVTEVGHTEVKVSLMEMSDDWNQSTVSPAEIVLGRADLVPSNKATVTFKINLTGAGKGDDVINYVPKVDGAVRNDIDLFVNIDNDPEKENVGPQLDIAINDGTLRKETIDKGLMFENYVKGSLHGYKFHDTNLNGVEDGNDTPFNGIEFSPADANGNLLTPDYTFDSSLNPTHPNYILRNGIGTNNGGKAPTHGTWAWDGANGHNSPGSAVAKIGEDKTASITIQAFTPFSAGIGFSKLINSNDPGDKLSFYIDDVLQATFTGKDAGWNDYWVDGVEWGWHKYTWTFVNDKDDPDNDYSGAASAWIDQIRFTSMTGGTTDPAGTSDPLAGHFWIEDLRPGTYTAVERLDLAGQFNGEVMPSFMPVSQYGKSATATSSKTDPDPDKDPKNGYAPAQVLKKDVGGYGDNQLAWAAAQDFVNEHKPQLVTVDFDKAVFATGVTITESWGNGFVDQIELRDTDGNWHTIFKEGVKGMVDNTPDGAVADFTVTLPRMTDFQVNGVRVTIDPMHAWSRGQDEQIDAIQLHGMMMTKSSSVVTIKSGQELVTVDGGAMLPEETLRYETNVGGQLVFADFVKGSIHGIKFEDYDADGVYEPGVDQSPQKDYQGDRGWAGFEFQLFKQDILTGDFTVLVGTGVSNGGGEFWFTGLKPGEYLLKEIGPTFSAPDGWIMSSTQRESRISVGSGEEIVWANGAAMLDSNSPSVKVEVVDEEDSLSFGNYVKGSIHGFKFEDYNGDGVYDLGAGDKPFGGITFVLSRLNGPEDTSGGQEVGTQVTNKDGEFWFTGLVPGWYRITENFFDNPIISTTDDGEGQVVFVGSREELVWKDGAAMLGSVPKDAAGKPLKHEVNVGQSLYFGNAVTGSIHGFKCEDIDADGRCETTANVVFVIDASASMLGDILEIEAGDPAKDSDDIPGDYNGDGISNTKLDAALVAVNQLVAQLPALPSTADFLVSVVVIQGSGAYELDFGGGKYTSYRNTGKIADALKTIDGVADANTNFQAGLLTAASQLAGATVEANRGNVYVLSDGYPNTPAGQTGLGLSDEVAFLSTYADNLIGVGIGEDASLESLSVIDPLAKVYPTMQSIKDNVKVGGNLSLPELPMAGVVFELSLDGQVIDTETTNANGEFWFTDLAPGNYTVREVVPTGMKSSTGDTWSRFIGSREEYAWAKGKAMLPTGSMKVEIVDGRLTFGNYVDGSIHGFKFNDKNGNGVYEPGAGDKPLAGVNITLVGVDGSGKVVSSSTISDLTGQFWFENLRPGNYTVSEVDEPELIPTTSVSSDFRILSGQEFVWKDGAAMLPTGSLKYEVLADGDDNPLNDPASRLGEDLIFGNTILGSIHGFKFHDYDADGVYEWRASGDVLPGQDKDNPSGIDKNGDGFINFYADLEPSYPGLQTDSPWAGFVFDLKRGGTTIATATSGSNGEFWFENLLPGTYTVVERDPNDNVHPSTPSSVTVNVASGEEHAWDIGRGMPSRLQNEVVDTRLRFGNYIDASIHGCVFLDDNPTDGSYDPSREDPQGGVPVNLVRDGAVLKSTITGFAGLFNFTGLKPGSYQVVVGSLPAGWVTTTTQPLNLFVASGDELVHTAGSAGPIAGNQKEVIIGKSLFVGVAPIGGPAAVAAALLSDEGQLERSTKTDSTAVDLLLASDDQDDRYSVDLSRLTDRRTRRAWSTDDSSDREFSRSKGLLDQVLADMDDDDLGAFLA